MKILNAEQIRDADRHTMEHEPIASIDLMERAASNCYKWLLRNLRKLSNDTQPEFAIFCGMGNNGGDGLVIARKLLQAGYSVVTYQVCYSDKTSTDFDINYDRLKAIDHQFLKISNSTDIPEIPQGVIVIDAIFGTGLSRAPKGMVADLIDAINKSQNQVISIDMPSGLFCSPENISDEAVAIRASYTLTFEVPKLPFLLPQFEAFVGKWTTLPIGLSRDFINSQSSDKYFVLEEDVSPMIKRRSRFGHKGTYGNALIIAGSKGMMGASVLATRACITSGAGLVTAHTPGCGYDIMQNTVSEAKTIADETQDHISEVLKYQYNAIAVGPGIGMHDDTQKVLKQLIQNVTTPLVIDADALNILSEQRTWMHFLTPNSILTPHPKEFERLVGYFDKSDLLDKLVDFSKKFEVYIVYKQANTIIATPNGMLYFNSTGNPGMGTGGTGDVLTGILTGLLAQGYSSLEACLVGVFIHGLAGNLGTEIRTPYALTAGDLINYLPNAFRQVGREFKLT